MEEFGPTHRQAVSYIDKSRNFYLNKGFGNPYRWATNGSVPFTPLNKPLAESRIGVVTTAALDERAEIKRELYAAPTDPIPSTMYTNHLSWHKTATHTRDVGSFLPLWSLNEMVATGRLASLSPRFYGVPTNFSQRRTRDEFAPAILNYAQEDEIDVAILVPL